MRNSRKTNPNSNLKKDLNTLLLQCDFDSFLSVDPLQFPHRFSNPLEQEVVALFSALLAYGRVSAIRQAIQHWLDLCEGAPLACIQSDDLSDALQRYKPWSYRFTRGTDLAKLSLGLKAIYTQYQSLGAAFSHWDDPQKTHLIFTLQSFYDFIHYESRTLETTRSFSHFLSSPYKKSALKRLHLFLRWMVRGPDQVDLGLWSFLDSSRLLMPVDVHIFRIAQALGWTSRKSVSQATVLEITENLKIIDASDPTRFDFALAHLGISQICKKKYVEPICSQCSLFHHCTLRL